MAIYHSMEFGLKAEQRQILSQKMIQSAQILQMNAQELAGYIRELALENPVVDIVEKAPEEEKDKKKEQETEEWLNTYEDRSYTSFSGADTDADDREDFNFRVDEGESLAEYLRAQLMQEEFPALDRKILDFMLESLDSRGYMTEDPDYIAKAYGVSTEDVERLLGIIKRLDPAGVGARNLSECLLLQAQRSGILTPLLESLIKDHLEDIAANRLPYLAKCCGTDMEELAEALKTIRELNPKPGNSFSDRRQLKYITPDVIFIKFADHFDILLNERLYPGIRVNEYYKNLSHDSEDKEVVEYLNGKIRQTEWVKECIEKRNSTLLKISRQLFLFQKEFFLHGNQALRPLRMADVAEALEVHESTVSRAVKGKYLQCAYGVYPMSYFFRGGITSGEGTTVATDRVKERIREIIGREDRKKPLSDQKICDMLEEEGLGVSRRAVAKYRDEMGIPATSKRRTYGE